MNVNVQPYRLLMRLVPLRRAEQSWKTWHEGQKERAADFRWRPGLRRRARCCRIRTVAAGSAGDTTMTALSISPG